MKKISFPVLEEIMLVFSVLWNKGINDSDTEKVTGVVEAEEYLAVLMEARRALKLQKPYHYDVRKAWAKVDIRISKKALLLRRLWKYAAIMLLLLGTVLYFSLPQQEEKDVYLADGIQPERERAELWLATGEKVELNHQFTEKNLKSLGVKLINNASENKLQYQVDCVNSNIQQILNTLIVPKGGEYSMFLADGSEVWMNSETSLQFPVRFSAEKREVWLEGEACFKVAGNPDVPFIVHLNGCDITVLGTFFNVCAYVEDQQYQMTLVEGKIQITDMHRQLIMQPSEQYTLNPLTGNHKLETVDAEMYIAWLEGKLYFNALTLAEIVRKLQRWYDFTMIYRNETVRLRRFSGTIDKDRSLEQTLRYLEAISDLRFTIDGKTIIADKN